MSSTWKRAAVALLLRFSGVTLFAAAACASAATPAPSNTPGMEVTSQGSPRVGGTDMPVPTTGPKATSEENGEGMDRTSPKTSRTDTPTPVIVLRTTSGNTEDIPATDNAPKDTAESIRRGDGASGDDQASIQRSGVTSEDNQAPPIPDKGELNYPNLGSRLDGLVISVEAGQVTAREAAANTPVHSGESVAVTIYLTGSVDEVVSFLEDNGGDPRNVGEDYIEAYVPVTLLGSVSEHPGVIRVREIVSPEPGRGG